MMCMLDNIIAQIYLDISISPEIIIQSEDRKQAQLHASPFVGQGSETDCRETGDWRSEKSRPEGQWFASTVSIYRRTDIYPARSV